VSRRKVIADPDVCAFCGEEGDPGDPLVECDGELVHDGCVGAWRSHTAMEFPP
jgi:hypothetical protein